MIWQTLLYGTRGGPRVDTGFVCISKGPSRCWDIIWSFICLFSQLITTMLHKENNHFDTIQTTLTYNYIVVSGQQGSDE